MKAINIKYKLFIILYSVGGLFMSYAQSYQKDSLQIKSYTDITFKDRIVQSIKLKNVFCDYCTERQKELIGVEALRRSEYEITSPKNRLDNGIKRLAIYIRIAKIDFAALREEEKLTENKKHE